MTSELEILKGVHPGIVLEKKIREKGFNKGRFALLIDEYPQTLSAITMGKRDMNTALSLKAEHALGLDEGYFMILQVYYDIREEKMKQQKRKPELSHIRKAVFWDTDMDRIDWERQWKAVIRRVFERGNDREKDEITRFYGATKIAEALNTKSRN